MSSAVDFEGKVIGIIKPPPEVRVVVDKTAQFVARNGKSFEERILGSEEGKTAKFHFLRSYHPFNAYYEKRIKDFKEGKDKNADSNNEVEEEEEEEEHHDNGDGADEAIAAEQDEDRTTPTSNGEDAMHTDMSEEIGSLSMSKLSSLMNPLARFANADITQAPSSFEFCLSQSFGLTAEDADTIKLTARYAAANGSEFVAKLAKRELGNPKFDFLNPSHTLFSFFSRLVDMYRRIIKGAPDLRVSIESKRDTGIVLKSAVHRWSWVCAQEEKERKRSSRGDDVSAAPIDWADFTVVETITFGEDELLSASTSIGATAAAREPTGPTGPGLESKRGVHGNEEGAEAEGVLINGAGGEAEDELHVVTDYQPRLAGTDNIAAQQRTMIDPISGKAVPVEQMSEHLKIQLADPRGRVDHQRFLEKQKETGIAAGDSMVSSLMQFAEQRKDIFGGEEAQAHGRGAAPVSSHSDAIKEGPPSRPLEAPWNPGNSNNNGGERRAHSGLRAVVQAPPQVPGGLGMPMPVHPPLAVAPFPGMGMAPSMGGRPPMPGRPVDNTPAWMQQQQQMPPPPPPMAPVPIATEEGPDLKRARVEGGGFSSLSGPSSTIQLHVQCADDNGSSSYNLRGQTVSLASVDTKASVKALKAQLSSLLGMPANKMNLRLPSAGPKDFIRDTALVESSGLVDGATVLLSARVRGGR